MKIAVVGAGISGLTAAYLLSSRHEVHVFEAAGQIGGHTHTVTVSENGKRHQVDMGFIVFNDRTYPNFIELLRQLGVSWQPSDMSFSVQCARTGIEFRPSSLDGLFTQRRNLTRPWFYRMLLDLARFRRHVGRLRASGDDQITLGDYLEKNGYSRAFRDYFIIPMGAAIWSSDPHRFHSFPARYFADFFHNHGILDIHQPQWLTISGGSSRYLPALTQPFRDHIHRNAPVEAIRRREAHVAIKTHQDAWQRFDAVIMATHSDQALKMLEDPSRAERDILGAITYQPNDVVLHNDPALLPAHSKAWASWNYHIPAQPTEAVALTYNMNMLQSLDSPSPYCVTLNRTADIRREKIISERVMQHPVYTPDSLAARARHEEINGHRRTYYCGAYWGYGFHEDGVNSALAVTRKFDIGLAS